MVRLIVREFDPDQIILFGSHARGTAGEDSDVDLLIVMPVAGSKREKRLAIRLALHEFDVPKGIMVTTPEEFAWRKEIPGTVERPAAREGKVLYGRPSGKAGRAAVDAPGPAAHGNGARRAHRLRDRGTVPRVGRHLPGRRAAGGGRRPSLPQATS
jgi:predicted nucleotidyltransferase